MSKERKLSELAADPRNPRRIDGQALAGLGAGVRPELVGGP
jgi:hypothetical protein